ncbi:lipocalin-like domain-containing protein [Streptomyces mirabilis]|uniref:lipocalin-like domain-containing protein n=1 Tax=Streptomyces mirabilis TaxID=68239 RepID=UPI0036AC3EDA
MSTPELTWTGDRNVYMLSVKGEDARIDFIATASGPPLLMNGQGRCSSSGSTSRTSSRSPAMGTTGTVVLDSQPYEVTGISWLDRQRGRLPDFFADSLGQSQEAAQPSAPQPVR